MKVLFFAPHPDDMEFFAGGTIADHVRRGDEIFEVIVSHGERHWQPHARKWRRRREAEIAANVLGVQHVLHCNFAARAIPYDRAFRTIIKSILRRVKPDMVYAPSDRHRIDFWIRDHLRLGQALVPLLQRLGVRDLRLHGTIRPTALIDISRVAPLVRRALRLHHSQQCILRSGGLLRTFFTWLWGRRLGVKYAEGYSLA